MTSLDSIVSIINGYLYAKDTDRVFTYIEFIKMFGYENDTNTFITVYKDYVTRWAAIKKQSINISDDDFVMTKMVDILKSITLDYSSYEQQDFIAHIDLSNKSHIKALSALFSRKIRQITEFYRKKRNESVTVIRKNSMKGSKKSIEQIVYEKIFDFVFSNRNIFPSYKNIKRDLMVSVENYVDTYSQYFDIPRHKEFTDKSRAEMLSANMNDVDYRVYLEIELVISQILFSGNVYLQEIPLVAQVGVDLSQSCVGDMLALKNNLMANTQVNQVDLNEQVALKRKLYEKFLGCDLWYMYVDLQGNITMDVLCKAKNPTGNLLNCGTADTATIQSSELKLLSQIGLFFKPEKTSILKVNAKDYTWTVDTDVIQNDTMYVFPDPNRYGDIGNNKSAYYPLLMQYKFNYDIRNLSSGEAVNDPIKMITDQGWYSYYSKQDDDFKTIDNKNYEYIFTWLCNRGYISNYQQDIWGNHFGILKGCEIKYKYDQKGNKVGVDTIILQENHNNSELKDVDTGQEIEGQALLLNGGYFEDPFHKGEIKTVYEINPEKNIQKYGLKDATAFYKDKAELLPFRVNKTSRRLQSNENITEIIYVRDFANNKSNKLLQRSVRRQITVDELKLAGDNWKKYYVAYKKPVKKWVFKSPQYEIGRQDKVVPFPFQKKMKLTDTYRWSGISIKNEKFFYPDTHNFINYGTFERNIRYNNETAYVDNFGKTNLSYQTDKSFDEIITDILLSFATQDVYTNKEVNVKRVNTPFQQMQKKSGQFYIKTVGNIYDKPKKVQEVFDWVNWEAKGSIYSFSLVKNTLIVQSDTCISFIPYTYDGYNITSTLGLKQQFVINKPANSDTQMLFVEHKNLIYVLQISVVKGSKKMWLKPIIYSFNPSEYTMKQVLNAYDVMYKELFQSKKLDKERQFSSFVTLKDSYAKNYDNYAAYKAFIEGSETYANEYEKFRDFQIPYSNVLNPVQDVVFSYNSSLGLFLISYCYIDSNSTPYIFEHKFKLDTMQYFCGSLVSSVYTIKKVVDANDNIVDVNYRYNDRLTSPTKMVTFPQTSNVGSIFTLATSGSYINGKAPVYVQPQGDNEDEENWQIDWVTPPNSQDSE